MDFIILATGQSLTQSDVDYCRDKGTVIAVSDAYLMAPWAAELVSHDSRWWRQHEKARNFQGRKICAQTAPGAEVFRLFGMIEACNSGLYAMFRARSLGAERIILLGFDMHGTHFFGKHVEPLENTTEEKFLRHINQFKLWSGCQVINCTPNSALKQFPMADLRETLPETSI